MQDKSIDGALIALRKQIIRENLGGLEHVEALLRLRSVSMPRVMPAKRPDVARKGHMRLLVLEALRSGPMWLCELVDMVQARKPDIPPERASQRVSNVLWKLRKDRVVVNERGAWRLAP